MKYQEREVVSDNSHWDTREGRTLDGLPSRRFEPVVAEGQEDVRRDVKTRLPVDP